jgi:PleD family two-component response regulator
LNGGGKLTEVCLLHSDYALDMAQESLETIQQRLDELQFIHERNTMTVEQMVRFIKRTDPEVLAQLLFT